MNEFEFKRLDQDQIKELAEDIFKSSVFTERHINENDVRLLQSIFMPLVLGALSGITEEQQKQVGMIYEYLEKAGPRSVNGYPVFFSMKILHIDDSEEVWDMYFKMKKAVENA